MSIADQTQPLLDQITCPNCWHRFAPTDIAYISRHDSLLGDPVAGPNAQMRFRPSRFSLDWHAVDPAGMLCHQLACPRCHLGIPQAALHYEPVFVSIVGSPASGKSFLLGTMTWMLRKLLPEQGIQFTDTDPGENKVVHSYEQTLFLASDPNLPVSIRKTELDGAELYRPIRLGTQEQLLPQPFMFTMAPTADQDDGPARGRLLMLYDNAGEHFLPGSEQTRTPVTEHLAKSKAIMFVFDPTQDPRLRTECSADDPQLKQFAESGSYATSTRQESVLSEAASRVRSHLRIPPAQRHKEPLIVILAKADCWIHNIPEIDLESEPFVVDGESGRSVLDHDRIMAASEACESFLSRHCPEFVATARGFSEEVVYVPVSAIGTSPEAVEKDGSMFIGIRPSEIKPRWSTVPFNLALEGELNSLATTPTKSGGTTA